MNTRRLVPFGSVIAVSVVLACNTTDSLGELGRPLGRSGGFPQDDSSTPVDRGAGGLTGAGGFAGGMGGAGVVPPPRGGASSGGFPPAIGGAVAADGGAGRHPVAGSDGGAGRPPAIGADGGTGKPPIIGPDGGVAYQIVTPNIIVPVGAEFYRCYHARVPTNVEVQATAFSSTAAALNELMVYGVSTDTAPDGMLDTTGCAGDTWLYAAYRNSYELRMPAGVAMRLSAAQPVMLDMHFVNAGSGAVNAKVALTIETAAGQFQQAGSFVSFNTDISIPPKGKLDVGGDCTLPAGAKLFSLTTHTNARATDASVARTLANGQLGELLVHTTNYANPVIASWKAPQFATLGAGEKLHYACSYSNPGTSTITVGTSALTNEMCMAIGYYFPAGTTTCN